ncbi:MAG: glycosyltransferase family 2 protein [Desulfomonilaceae bacterium]|nr:glycosyltransferase family 2 protein [Desulfomonilaceae bacterium]
MKSSSANIAVLLAAYNGERYLAEQIQSVLEQSWPHWHLHIRDDGSRDDTPALIARLASRFPDRIHVVEPDGPHLGPDGNFCRLLELTDSKYFMFCDQDDVWLPGKMERTLECMRELEAKAGEHTPLLVHTDACVVDSDLRRLDASAWHYGYNEPEFSTRLNRLLVQNMVFGCTVMINAALKRLAVPIPKRVVQYDWWLALVSACFGRTAYLSEPTLLYRRHENNFVGVRRWGVGYVLDKIMRVRDRSPLIASREQAAALLAGFRDSLSPSHREMLENYASLGDMGIVAKRKTLLKYRFFKTGLVRNVGLFAKI